MNNKRKLQTSNNDILKDQFFDIEMIYSFFISAILHALIVSFVLFILWSYFGVSYDQLIKNIFIKPDIIFNLEPLNPIKKDSEKEKETKNLKTNVKKQIKG